MKRQPEGIPTGGQFAADRKSEPAGTLAVHGAPAGMEDLPGTWGERTAEGVREYTSPAGRVLLVDDGDRPQVAYDPVDPNDSFQRHANAGDPASLREALNQSLTGIAAQEAAVDIMDYNGDVYDRMSVDVDWTDDGRGNRELQTVGIVLKDADNSRWLELTHNYGEGTTDVFEHEGGALDEASSATERDAILADLAHDDEHKAGNAHKEFFEAYKTGFGHQNERFGLG